MNETTETIEVYDSYGVLIGYNVITNYDDGQGNTGSSTSYYDVNWNSLGGTSTSTDSQGYSYTSDWSNSTSTDSAGNTVQTYTSNWSDSNGGSGSSELASIYDANWNQLSGSGTSSYSDGLGYSYTSGWNNSTNADSAGNTVQTYTSSWSDSYGNSGSSESTYGYDANGNSWGSSTFTDGLGYSSTSNWNSNTSTDSAGNTVQTYSSSWSDSYGNSGSSESTSTYDANGNSWGSSTTTDSQGYSYTSDWSNSTSTDSAGNTVQTYSSNWSDSNGGSGSSTSTYTYDAGGQFIGSTYSDGITTTVYDSNWNIVSQSVDVSQLTPDGQGGYFHDDGYGNITTYDANGVVTGHSSTYSYDDGLGNSYSSTSYYDANGNSWGSSTSTDSQGYSYTSNWSNSTSTDSAGNTIQTYSSSWSDSNGGSGSSESTYTYDAGGQFIGNTYSDGITTTWYDSNGQIIDQVSSDETAPTLQFTTPQDDALDVAVNSDITLTFDESIKAGSGNIVISDGLGDVRTIDVNDGSQVSFGFSKNGTTNTVTINPAEDLLTDSNYFVQLDAGVVTDLVGNAFAGVSDETTLNFVTAPLDTVAPTLQSITPQDDAFDVAVNSDITLTFDESIQPGSGNIVISDGLGDVRTIDINDGSQVSFGFSKNGTTNTVTINPAEDLLTDSNYFVQLDAGVVTDLTDNAFAGVNDETTLNFVTALGTTESVSQTSVPLDSAPVVPVNSGITVTTPVGRDITVTTPANNDIAVTTPTSSHINVPTPASSDAAAAAPAARVNHGSASGNGDALDVHRDTGDVTFSIENDAVPENPISLVGVTDIAGNQAGVLYSV
ncbi:Ig-like domain-containing protein [Methylobacter sp. sgz302048]|uniref:Ig-like domain-containing protein n=1 Tax=Methylobacter sp. sgz302048 TaxID=3455945 RepID=UPI003F9FD1AD